MVKMPPASSPIRHPYTAKQPLHWWALRIADSALSLLMPRTGRLAVTKPHRILLASGGHLGDGVVLTAAIRRVRELLPQAEIGLLIPSWSRVVVDGHPDVRWIHTIDHWRRNRAPVTRIAKLKQYRVTQRRALREMRDVGYDAAIDLYAWAPNMAIPLWRAGIPVRAGFVSGGLSPLYTQASGWGRSGRHMVDRHAELIASVLGDTPNVTAMRYDLAVNPHAATSAAELLAAAGVAVDRYTVVHMGSGRVEPTWPLEEWRGLVVALDGAFGRLIFTGRGAAERLAINQVVNDCAGCVNLCDAPAWPVFVELIRGAFCVITVDTAAAHVAAAVDTPSVVLWPDITDDVSWHPHGDQVRLVSRNAGIDVVASAMADVVGFARTAHPATQSS
jgi:ADP-heptose:LPS heptosyltransferase